ncbi:MAG: hypothetical protein K0S44_912 [Bacteroidetes bacterium]|jgi:hypothetical protein|nr:hypothetical protein [Bacteroidota bacterium]
MKYPFPVFFLFFFASINFFAQEAPPVKSEKGRFYFSWGYNKDWFSKSDIHFKNSSTEYDSENQVKSYDFILYNIEAKDRPGFKDIPNTELTIPQYVYRIGYYFNDKRDLAIELNFDHVKYVMRDWQTARLKGTIHGQYYDLDTMISPDNFLAFEHSDGANFLLLNIVKRHKLLNSKNTRHHLSAIIKVGAGIGIPKTRVQLFGETLDNRFHVAGFIAGSEGGLRYDSRYFFAEYTAKGSFANFTNVLVIGEGKASHHFWTLENILTIGLQFPL